MNPATKSMIKALISKLRVFEPQSEDLGPKSLDVGLSALYGNLCSSTTMPPPYFRIHPNVSKVSRSLPNWQKTYNIELFWRVLQS